MSRLSSAPLSVSSWLLESDMLPLMAMLIVSFTITKMMVRFLFTFISAGSGRSSLSSS